MKLYNNAYLIFAFFILNLVNAQDVTFHSSSSLSKNKYSAGESFKASIVENVVYSGGASFSSCYTAAYISKNQTIDSSDILLGTAYLNTLQSKTLTMPRGLEPGYYYLIVHIDYLNSVKESNEENNFAIYNIEILPDPQYPDLIGSIGTSGDTIYKQLPNDPVYPFVQNTGKKDTMEFEVSRYFSKDKALDPNDALLSTETYMSTDNGTYRKDYTDRWNINTYDSFENGPWYLIQKVDAKNSVKELNEYNNLSYRSVILKNTQYDYLVSQISINEYMSASLPNTLTLVPTYESKVNSMRVQLSAVLSLDSIIDSKDYIIESGEVTYSGGYFYNNAFRGSVTKNYTIPANALASGRYYLLVHVDPQNKIKESNENNNVYKKVVNFTASNVDLGLVYSGNYEPWTYATGNIFESYQLLSNGSSSKEATYVKFYLSKDEIWTENDLFLGLDTGTYAVNKNAGYKNYSLSIPQQVQAGDYYVLAIVDQTNLSMEYNEKNNSYVHKLHVKDKDKVVVMPEKGKIEVKACSKTLVYPNANYPVGKRISIATIAPEDISQAVSLTVFTDYNYNYSVGVSIYDGADTTAPILWRSNYYPGPFSALARNPLGVLTIKVDNNVIRSTPPSQNTQQYLFQANINACLVQPTNFDFAIKNMTLAQNVAEWNRSLMPQVTYIFEGIKDREIGLQFYISNDTLLSQDDRKALTTSVYASKDTLTMSHYVAIDSLNGTGHKYLIAQMDPQNKFNDTVESNNVKVIPFEIKKPVMDLAVSKIVLNKTNYLIGEKIFGKVKLVNNGTLEAAATKVSIVFSSTNSGHYQYIDCPAIPPKDSVWLDFSYLIAEGTNISYTYYINALADYSGVVNEYNEKNNSLKSASFAVSNFVAVQKFINGMNFTYKSCISGILNTYSSFSPSEYVSSSVTFKPADNSSRVKVKMEPDFISLLLPYDETYRVIDLKTNQVLKTFTSTSSWPSGQKVQYFKSSDTSGIKIEYIKRMNYSDKVKITGTCEPFRTSNDLVMSDVSVHHGVNSGHKIRIIGTVQNNGVNYFDSLRVRYFLSQDNKYSLEDVLLGEQMKYDGSIKIMEDSSIRFAVVQKLPASLKPKVYYIIAILDQTHKVLDSNLANNTYVSSFYYSNDIPQADISIAYPRVSYNSLSYGDYMRYNYQLFNQYIDNVFYPEFRIGFVVSKDSVLSPDDKYVKSAFYPSSNYIGSLLSTYNTHDVRYDSLNEDYYMIIKADYANEIAESNENNNTLVIPIRPVPRSAFNIRMISELNGLKTQFCHQGISSDTVPRAFFSSTFTILSDPSKILQLNFKKFNLKAGHYLEVYEGSQTLASKLLGKYTGSVLPSIITKASGPLTIKYAGDSSSQFLFYVDCIEQLAKSTAKDLWSKNLEVPYVWKVETANELTYDIVNVLSDQVVVDNIYYLSVDSTLDDSDVAVGCHVDTLTESLQHFSKQLSIAPSWAQSKYKYLIQHVDAYNRFNELDEFNNIRPIPVKFNVVTAVEENDAPAQLSDVKLFPNPNNGLFEVILPEDCTLEFVDAYGKLCKREVASQGSHKYDLQNLPSGLYMIRCLSEKGVWTKSFIKE